MFTNLSSLYKKYWRMSAIRQAFILINIFTIILLLCWFIINLFVERNIIENIDRKLSYDIQSISLVWQSEKKLTLRSSKDNYYMIIPNSYSYVGRIVNGAIFPDKIISLSEGYHNIELIGENGQKFSSRALISKINNDLFVSAQSLINQIQIKNTINQIFLVSFIFSIIFITVGLFSIARNTQIKISNIEKNLYYIKSGRLKTRIRLKGNDDLVRVSNSINETTQQLENLMDQFKNQSANLAHELKTPLTSLRLNLEQKISLNKINKKSIKASILQIDHIINIFDTIIKIARIQGGSERKNLKKIKLIDYGKEIFETYEPVIEDKGFNVIYNSIDGNKIKLDKDLIFILVTNLIQNALKYSKPATTIIITFGPDEILIEDEGPGIPLNKMTRVVEPMYRLRRESESGGYGLGLSMVKAICEIHNAELIIKNKNDKKYGLIIGIKFKKKIT